MKSDRYLDVAQHPRLVFTSTGMIREGSDWIVTGDFEARGVKSPVSLRTSHSEFEEGRGQIVASCVVNRFAHGVTKMKFIVGAELRCDLDIGLTPASSG